LGYEVKGYLFRGILGALEQEGLLMSVRDKVPPEVRAVIQNPPLAGAWMEGGLLDAVSDVVLELHGVQALRRIHGAGVNRGAMTVLRPVAESVMRMLGVAPGKLLGQLNRMQQSAVRGLEHKWQETGPNAGVLTTTVDANVPASFFEGTAGSMEVVFTLCGVAGKVGNARMQRQDGRTVGSMDVTWTPRK
jgi:hypothetical protein